MTGLSFERRRLYAFIDTAYLDAREPELVARQLCDGGADLIQLRAKDRDAASILRMAEQILSVTEPAGVGLVVNDHPDVAVAIGACACHLGQEDFFDAGFLNRSDVLPESSSVGLGLSTHRPDQARRAVAAGADYLGVGPVHATGTKPTARPVTLEYVRWAAENVEIPWFAIGGINLANVDQVIAAGARRIAVVSAILNAPDVAKACQAFRARLG